MIFGVGYAIIVYVGNCAHSTRTQGHNMERKMQSTPRLTTAETIASIIERDRTQRAGYEDRIVRVEKTCRPAARGWHYDLMFMHADGRRAVFPGHAARG